MSEDYQWYEWYEDPQWYEDHQWYVKRVRAMMTIARFLYGREVWRNLGAAGVWELHDRMTGRTNDD